MLWWRLELDGTGSILKCEQVEAVGKGTALVAYVQATDKAGACSSAKAWFEKRRAQNRDKSRRYRADRIAKGLCVACGRAPHDYGIRCCAPCQARQNEKGRRARLGELPRRVVATPEEARAKHEQTYRRYNASRVGLDMILRKFDDLGPERFRAWLTFEIAQRDVTDYAAQAAE